MNMMVSICCLTYNHVHYIKACLDGFLMQKTTFQFEILIHDDASTDGTTDIIREYEAKFPNIVKPIYQSKNQYSIGVKPTFKYNFPRAKGKYIAMCEGDDYWTDPLKLQKQVDFLNSNEDFNICFTYSNKVNHKGENIENTDALRPIIHTSYTILVGKKFQTRTCTMLFRGGLLSSMAKIKSVYNGDTWLKIYATKDSKGITLPFISAVYRVHSGGVWSTISTNEQNRRSYFDWKQKFHYAIENNLRSTFLIFYNMSKSFFIWNLLKILGRK